MREPETCLRTSDPMEQMIEAALIGAGIDYLIDGDEGQSLDFLLPAYGVHIEVKRFHSARIAEQMARAPNVIAAQGKDAVELLAALIRRSS
jgi:hypothetical protein